MPLDAPFDERIQAMIEAYAEGCGRSSRGGYDVVHAQDCLSANAALRCATTASIDHVIRTVHHVDDFTSPSLIACQDRSIVDPTACCACRSRGSSGWPTSTASAPSLVRNGVDPPATARATTPSGRARGPRPGLGDRFAVMTVGGIEPRKGSLTLLDGFAACATSSPSATRCC